MVLVIATLHSNKVAIMPISGKTAVNFNNTKVAYSSIDCRKKVEMDSSIGH